MTWSHFAVVYAIGWFVSAAVMMISMYRSQEVKDIGSKLKARMDEDPEMAAHWNDNVHGIRTRVALITAALPILIAVTFSSIWWLWWTIRLVSEVRGRTRP